LSGAVPLDGLALNDAVGATGADETVIVLDAEVDPFAFDATSVAVNVPAA